MVVPKPGRLARSVPDAREIGDSLVARGVRLSLGGTVYDPADPMGKMFFNRARQDQDRRRRGDRSMTAQPIHEPAPDDPAGILQRLPLRWHAQFLTEYRAALDAAREVRRWPQLSDLLHRWRLRASAYARGGPDQPRKAH